MKQSTVSQVVEKLTHLPDDLQQKVLEFVKALTASVQHGASGREMLRFAGAIPLNDLHLMRLAIEAGCEQVDVNEW